MKLNTTEFLRFLTLNILKSSKLPFFIDFMYFIAFKLLIKMSVYTNNQIEIHVFVPVIMILYNLLICVVFSNSELHAVLDNITEK